VNFHMNNLYIATIIYIISVVCVAAATVTGQSLIGVTLRVHAGDGAR
jgi:hypothetical protein